MAKILVKMVSEQSYSQLLFILILGCSISLFVLGVVFFATRKHPPNT